MKRARAGTGTIERLASGKFRYRMYIPGTRKRASGTGVTQKEAIQNAERKVDQILKRQKFECELTLVEYASQYVRKQYNAKRIKASSLSRDICTIKNQIQDTEFGNMPMVDIGSKHIKQFFGELLETDLSASTIEKVCHIISKTLRSAYEEDLIPGNPFDKTKSWIAAELRRRNKKEKATKERQILVFSDDEIAKIKKVISEGEYVASDAVGFLLETGIRISELIGLKWKDYLEEEGKQYLHIRSAETQITKYDEENNPVGTVMIHTNTKEDVLRIIPLRKEAVSILKRKEGKGDPESYIFVNSKNKRFTTSCLEANIARVYRRAGLDEYGYSAHIFRRTFVTNRHKEGYSVEDIAAYIGDDADTVRKHYLSTGEMTDINGKRVEVVRVPATFLE